MSSQSILGFPMNATRLYAARAQGFSENSTQEHGPATNKRTKLGTHSQVGIEYHISFEVSYPTSYVYLRVPNILFLSMDTTLSNLPPQPTGVGP